MALIKCRECGKDVSTEASACPSCGAPVAKPQKGASVVGALVMIVAVAVGVATCSGDDDKKEAAAPAAVECAKGDLQCLGDKAVVAAGIYCKDPIERLAKYSVRWTDGTFETKFSRFRWRNKDAGELTMIGDKAEFQNGFGAFAPVTYECDLGSDGKTVLDVRAHEGRLPS